MSRFKMPSFDFTRLVEDRFSLLDSEDPLVSFWDLLSVLLRQKISDLPHFIELLDTIHALLQRSYASDFGTLRRFMEQESCCEGFFSHIWPALRDLALEFPSIFPTGRLNLLTDEHTSLSFSRREIACLVVHQFLCSIPTPDWFTTDGSPDFHIWYASEQPHAGAVHAYLTALFTYFSRVTSREENDEAKETRAAVRIRLCSSNDDIPTLCSQELPLCKLKIILIPEASTNSSYLGLPNGAAVISANKSIGFGRTGTQEEVNVGSSPEACPAVLFIPILRHDQVLIVEGAEAIVSIKGYGRLARFEAILEQGAFQWTKRTMLFMDALELDAYDGTREVPDLLPGHLDRELRKAYTAFSSGASGVYEEIVTGLWGCRSFCGDEQIKTLLQWCAASLAGVPMITMVISEGGSKAGFVEKLRHFDAVAKDRGVTVAEIYRVLNELDPKNVKAREAIAVVEAASMVTAGTS